MNKHKEGFIWYLYGAMTTHLLHLAFPDKTYQEREDYLSEREERIYRQWEQEG